MKQEKRSKKRWKMSRSQLTLLAEILLIMAVLVIAGLFYMRSRVIRRQEINAESYEQFERHYAFITNSVKEDYRSEIYEGAREYAREEKIYLEWFGKDLDVDFSKEELLKMAVASRVDGIILEGDGSEKTQTLINEAVEEGIPVVTVMTDSYDSKRQGFVGTGNHNLGREYGRQILRIAKDRSIRALILMDASAEDSGQNIIFNGIRDTIANEGNYLDLTLDTLAIGEDSPFGEEEIIRALFLDKENLPDVIICLNEENTMSTYQAAVDYNMVGEIAILGYSVNPTILNAISRNVIASACVVDYRQMGIYCIMALDEYIETGHVNDFVIMDVSTITGNNVERYREDVGERE